MTLRAPEPLTRQHDVGDFNCGTAPLDFWLKDRARSSEGSSARTYVLCEREAVVGYYCLSAGAVARQALPTARLRKNAPDQIPLIVLGRLAIDRRYQGRGLGSALLQDAIRRCLHAGETIGIMGILVQAIDDQATQFYRKYGFMECPLGVRTLLLPTKTAAAALE
jgi:GNAT superfamily N-acetyltransferase